jgi:hypothetical protein
MADVQHDRAEVNEAVRQYRSPLLLKSISQIPIFAAARKTFDCTVRHIVLFARAQDKSRGVYPCAIMTSCPMDSWQ